MRLHRLHLRPMTVEQEINRLQRQLPVLRAEAVRQDLDLLLPLRFGQWVSLRRSRSMLEDSQAES